MLPLQADREASSGVGAFFYERHRPEPTSTAEVETTEIRAKGDAKACPRMPRLVDSVSFLTVDFRQKGVYASCTPAWRDIMGKNFPTMAVVGVTDLVEKEALIEIETTAVIPH